MAYAAAASLSHTIDIVLNFYQKCFDLKLKNQIISLQKHTIFLGSFLEESPGSANNWEEVIIEATEMAEDVIRLILSDLLLGRTVGSSRSSFGEGGEFQLPYGFVELERAIQQIESIVNRVNRRHAEVIGGPDDEVMEIVSLLLHSSWRDSIVIFGREGMGKTTLAKNVYNHPLVMEHFDIRAWCALSTEYDWSKIASGLPSVLFENKSRMRFLIVVDDVRTLEDLKMINYVLPSVFGHAGSGYNGSRVLATTRFFRLSESVDHFHHMHFMDGDKSWNMLQKKIFGRWDHYPVELETLGKKIAISCRGHPLTMDVVSGILAVDQTVAAWEDISDNIDIASENVDISRLRILASSFQTVFLVFEIFPQR